MRFVLSFALGGILSAAWSARVNHPTLQTPAADVLTIELAERDVQISTWKKALAADSSSAIALSQLAALYMQRGRETGDERNYLEAERYARQSVEARISRNGAAFVTLASALLAQHRFIEADSVLTVLVDLEPDVPQYRSMLGEVKLELGDYETARTLFTSVLSHRTHLSIAPRLSRWMEIEGNVPAARQVLAAALNEAAHRRDIPREQVAWFHLRAGDLELRNGRLRTAAKAFRDGLDVSPGDYRLLAAMARLESVRRRPRSAIEYGERAIALKLDPATLGTIGDAYAAVGDSARAEEYFRTAEVAVAGQPYAYHRTWSLFLLDHDRRVEEVLANARRELETRRDAHGYDILAWALHKSGRNAEARDAIVRALRPGTRDATLFYHAGVIHHSLGDTSRSRVLLTRSLEINRRFHPSQVDHARALLEAMKTSE